MRRRKRTRHSDVGTPLYGVWQSMIQRCQNPKSSGYENYGGRGITVCAEWDAYLPFRDWALSNGYVPRMVQLDRIDNDGPYSPENCRFATSRENSLNKRSSVRLSLQGEEKTAVEWSEDPRCVVPYRSLLHRLERGWDVESALTCQDLQHRKHALRPGYTLNITRSKTACGGRVSRNSISTNPTCEDCLEAIS